MSKTKVKICGVRTIEAAQVAVDEGVDFLGFNFVKVSKRYINPKIVKKIVDELRVNHKLKVDIVGIFQNSPIEEVNKIAGTLNLDFIQLHGEEDYEYRKRVNYKIIKRIDYELELANCIRTNLQFFLVDRKTQGHGKMVNLKKAEELANIFPLFFSGGLTPENVVEVIKKVRPFAVDVAGGVETDGKQDLEKIKQFIRKVKSL